MQKYSTQTYNYKLIKLINKISRQKYLLKSFTSISRALDKSALCKLKILRYFILTERLS